MLDQLKDPQGFMSVLTDIIFSCLNVLELMKAGNIWTILSLVGLPILPVLILSHVIHHAVLCLGG